MFTFSVFLIMSFEIFHFVSMVKKSMDEGGISRYSVINQC